MFEQDLILHLNLLISSGFCLYAELTGVNEENRVGEAMIKKIDQNTNTIVEKRIFLYEINNEITYKIIGPFENNRTSILVSEPKREAYSEDEPLPTTEIIDEGEDKYIQVRYDFYEQIENEIKYFYFKYIDIPNSDRDTIINALIRSKYTPEQENAILRKKLYGIETLDFLKLNNWIKYSKAVADGLSLNEIKSESIYEITIPLDLCNLGYDYGGLAFQTLIKNINFESDSIQNTGKAYPSWISNDDMTILTSDPRVSITQISLYDNN